MEPRRIPRGRSRTLRHVSYRDQQAGRTSESQAFQGGLIPMQNWYAPSPHVQQEAGLGDWSLEDISDYLRKGVSSRGAVYGPMSEVVYNSLQYMTEADIHAMSVYLKGLRTTSLSLPSAQFPSRKNSLLMRLGKSLYTQQCANCHGSKGQGRRGALPAAGQQPGPSRWNPLSTRSAWSSMAAFHRVRRVIPCRMECHPLHRVFPMTRWAAVVTYIRSSWGNHGTAISARQVDDLRSATLD